MAGRSRSGQGRDVGNWEALPSEWLSLYNAVVQSKKEVCGVSGSPGLGVWSSGASRVTAAGVAQAPAAAVGVKVRGPFSSQRFPDTPSSFRKSRLQEELCTTALVSRKQRRQHHVWFWCFEQV